MVYTHYTRIVFRTFIVQHRTRRPNHPAATGGRSIEAAEHVVLSDFTVGAYGELVDFHVVRYGDVVAGLRARYVFPVHIALGEEKSSTTVK